MFWWILEEGSLKCLVWAGWMNRKEDNKKVWYAKKMEMAKGVGLASWKEYRYRKGIGIERYQNRKQFSLNTVDLEEGK